MEEYDFYISNKEINHQTGECLRGSWKYASMAGLIVLIFSLIPIVATILVSIFLYWWLSIPLAILSILIISIFAYGLDNFCLKIAKQELPNQKEVFAGFSKKIKAVLAITFKRLFLSIMWIILLIVPFFVKNIGYSMSNFLLCDEQKKDIKSENVIKESMHLMKQNYGRYAKFILSNIGWLLLILITGFLAFIWVAPILSTKKAVFYENLKTDF